MFAHSSENPYIELQHMTRANSMTGRWERIYKTKWTRLEATTRDQDSDIKTAKTQSRYAQILTREGQVQEKNTTTKVKKEDEGVKLERWTDLNEFALATKAFRGLQKQASRRQQQHRAAKLQIFQTVNSHIPKSNECFDR